MTLTEEAENLLLHQFGDAKNIKALVRALVAPLQVAHEELQKLHHGRYIDNAQEETLDVIGAIVGQPRNDMTDDDDYRPWIKVAILLNNSSGTAKDIVNILKILYRKENSKENPVEINEYAPNIAEFILESPLYPESVIVSIIRSAVPVTTKCQFMFKQSAANSSMSAMSIHVIADEKPLMPFQLDVSPFDQSYFLDFYQEE